MATHWIAPSILSADFARLGAEVDAVLAAGADLIHFDVMDNHYVPNLTVGPVVCEALRKHGVTAPIDVHLMVKPVDRIIPDFAKAGATYITFHPEASEHVDRTIELIRDHGCRPGLVFNPATPLVWLDHVIEKLDMILIMSVNPGFGGQKFIDAALPKLRQARARIGASGRDIRLEIDGGVKVENIAAVAAAGADTFVAGSAIFGSKDYRATLGRLKKEGRRRAVLEGVAAAGLVAGVWLGLGRRAVELAPSLASLADGGNAVLPFAGLGIAALAIAAGTAASRILMQRASA